MKDGNPSETVGRDPADFVEAQCGPVIPEDSISDIIREAAAGKTLLTGEVIGRIASALMERGDHAIDRETEKRHAECFFEALRRLAPPKEALMDHFAMHIAIGSSETAGMTAQDLANILRIHPSTVRYHVSEWRKLFGKYGLKPTRSESQHIRHARRRAKQG